MMVPSAETDFISAADVNPIICFFCTSAPLVVDPVIGNAQCVSEQKHWNTVCTCVDAIHTFHDAWSFLGSFPADKMPIQSFPALIRTMDAHSLIPSVQTMVAGSLIARLLPMVVSMLIDVPNPYND